MSLGAELDTDVIIRKGYLEGAGMWEGSREGVIVFRCKLSCMCVTLLAVCVLKEMYVTSKIKRQKSHD